MRHSLIAGNHLQHDGHRFGVVYTDGATSCVIRDNVINHCPAAPCILTHGGNDFTIGQHWYNDSEAPSLCCGALPKGANVSDYVHRLAPGAPWPAPAQAIIDNAGCRADHVAPSILGTTTSSL